MVNGQLAPDAGASGSTGSDIVGLQPRAIWRLGVGRTFQIAATFASLTVRENVQMALLSHAGDMSRLLARRRAALHRATRRWRCSRRSACATQADRPCGVLAYGDVKRVELAMALANEPRLLLMDEPTAGMAPRERNALMALVKRLVGRARHRRCCSPSTHGRGVRPRRPHHRAGARRADRRRRRRSDARRSASARGLFRHRHDIRALGARSARHDATPCSRSSGSSAWYGAAQILYDVSFEVGRGEVVALMGRNGAGKSTTMKAIMGLVAAGSGSVRFDGERHLAPASRTRSRASASASCRRTGASSPTSR